MGTGTYGEAFNLDDDLGFGLDFSHAFRLFHVAHPIRAIRRRKHILILLDLNRPPQRIQNIIHINIHTIPHTITLSRPPPNIEPLLGRKIHALGTVVPEVVPRVVPEREGDDEFALVVDEAVYRDALLFEGGGGGEEGFVAHELGTAFVVVGEVGAHHAFEFFGVALADRVPLFRGAKVDIVDGI